MGAIINDQGKFEESEIFLRKAIELKPNFLEAYNNLGLTLSGLNKTKEAKLFFFKALEINPNYIFAHYNLGVVFKKLCEWDDALKCFKDAIKIDSEFDLAISSLGDILLMKGNHAEGLRLVRKGEGHIRFDHQLSTMKIYSSWKE